VEYVKWSDIEAECGDYRDGFVQTFRKYEGQPTDEKDAQGRTVKVTVASFAKHAGIPKTTFQRWVSGTTRVLQPRKRAKLEASLSGSADVKIQFADEYLGQALVEVRDSGVPDDEVVSVMNGLDSIEKNAAEIRRMCVNVDEALEELMKQ